MTRLPVQLRFGLLCGASVVMEWRALAATLSLALNREEYTQILLVLPIAGTLVFLDHERFASEKRTSGGWGAAVCSAALVLAFLARFASGIDPDLRLALEMLAVVTWWVGAFILCFGVRVAWDFAFPLGFLLWLVPIPGFMLDRMITFLQQWSAFAAQAIFSVARVPVSQDGVFITIPGVTLEVAKECSSIRSSLMLVLVSMVLAQLELRTPWRKLLVVIVAVPLSVAKNGLRIFTIAMLGTRVDRSYLTGRLHHQGGAIFLLIALVFMFLLLWLLRKGEHRSRSANRVPGTPLKASQS